mmetsp:Transcript_20298/g.46526  ORF Transcript_20298/g.46526 Transcript_20298/m.46526 type:complete len:431 (-) Transcript_20298:247-1539(-)
MPAAVLAFSLAPLVLLTAPLAGRPPAPSPVRMSSALSPTSELGSLPPLSHGEIRRYSRHLILNDVGVTGQRRLKGAKVLCIGSGGLGSPALMYLSAAGVGTIGVVDDDVVDESNLQRQIIHSTSSVGTPKVESARTRVSEINPNVQLQMHQTRLTADNALAIIGEYDLVVDGCDNFPTRFLVNDACVILGKPLVYGAIQKFEGQVSVFNHRGGPNYRDLFSEPPPPGEVPSCAEAGVLGVLCGVIGTIQATEAIKIILDKGNSLSGRLLLYDALQMRFREVRLGRNPNNAPVTSLIDYDGFCGVPKKRKRSEGEEPEPPEPEPFRRISATECARRMREDGWAPFVLDVRSEREAEIVSLPFVDLLQPHRRVGHIVDRLPTDRDILVSCKVGGRSSIACRSLAAAGVGRLHNLDGGVIAWAKEVDPSLPTY